MESLSDLSSDQLSQLSNEDFESLVRSSARSLSSDALSTYEDVMNSSEDDKARVLAADRVLSLSGVDSNSQALPSGVSEEVFKIALSGLLSLAQIAQSSSSSPFSLKNVTPAASDPKKYLVKALPDIPKLETAQEVQEEKQGDFHERFEIRNPEDYDER